MHWESGIIGIPPVYVTICNIGNLLPFCHVVDTAKQSDEKETRLLMSHRLESKGRVACMFLNMSVEAGCGNKARFEMCD